MTKKNLHPIGAKFSPHDPRDIKLASIVVATNIPKPPKFDLRDQQSPVALQNFGSCEGFTAKDVKEYQEKKEHGQLIQLSGRFAYAVAKTLDSFPGQEGTDTRSLLKGLAGSGICLEEQFPNIATPTHEEYIKLPTDPKIFTDAMQYQISGFARCDTVDDVKVALLMGNMVHIAINVYETFDSVKADGFIGRPSPSTYNRGGHAISILGYDDTMNGVGAWLVKNHWDITWGDKGYGWLAYNYEGNFLPWMEAYVSFDQVDANVTAGAPINLEYPVDAPVVVTQPFGSNPANYAKFGLAGHEGIDFRARNAAPIYAIDAGKVIFVGYKADYGNTVIIEHTWGLSLYAHLSAFVVSDKGPDGLPPTVAKRTLLGRSGSTGNVTAEHLHLGGKINGVKNPAYKDWINLAPYFGKGNQRMLVFFKVKGSSTLWSLMDGEWVGFSDMTAFNNFVGGRPQVTLNLDQVEFDKVKANPDVFKQ